MKVQTEELTGAALDWAVAKCEGVPNAHVVNKPVKVCVYGETAGVDFPYQPSTDWAQGGPILEREKIVLSPYTLDDDGEQNPGWQAFANYGPPCCGPTPLIAAMRCLVASVLGEEVEVPEELT